MADKDLPSDTLRALLGNARYAMPQNHRNNPIFVAISGKRKKMESLGKDSGRCIYASGNSLSRQIVFGWDKADLLQRRLALQCVVEATTMVVAITRARVAIVVFATTLVRCNQALVQ